MKWMIPTHYLCFRIRNPASWFRKFLDFSLDALQCLISITQYLCRREGLLCALRVMLVAVRFQLHTFVCSLSTNSAFSKTRMLAEGLRLVCPVSGWADSLCEEGWESPFFSTKGWVWMFTAADAERSLNDIGREGAAASTKQWNKLPYRSCSGG